MESTWTARPATDEAFDLGEGPYWDAARQRLIWLDIRTGQVLAGRLTPQRIVEEERWSFDGMVGAVAIDASGSLVVANGERLVYLDPDGSRVDGPRVVPSGSGRRLNDGKPDPRGRFVVGTALIDEPGREILVRLEDDDSLTVIDDDLTLSNGLGWSVDGGLFYLADTYRQIVWVRDYDAETGEVGPRREFVTFGNGYPDGLCVDAEDHVWIAAYGAGEVRRFDPDGRQVGCVIVDAPNTTCPAFAGPDLDVLVITTAFQQLSPEMRAEFPESGRVFLADVGVCGTPVVPWVRPCGTIAS